MKVVAQQAPGVNPAAGFCRGLSQGVQKQLPVFGVEEGRRGGRHGSTDDKSLPDVALAASAPCPQHQQKAGIDGDLWKCQLGSGTVQKYERARK